MKKTLILMSMLATTVAQAEVYDWARVVEAEPVREWVRVPTEREVCWNERRDHRHGGNATDVVVGSVIGGVIGNQFGEGKGKDAATLAGALLGAAIASDAGKHAHADERHAGTVRRCRIETSYVERQEIVGYEVTYRYKGETYRTYMNHDPGDRIRVRVTVTPVE